MADQASLAELSVRLKRQLAAPLPRTTWPGPSTMAEAAHRIESLLGGASIEVVDPRVLAGAIRRLQVGERLTATELRVCAFGATTPAQVDGRTVRIVDERALTMLLRDQLAAPLRDSRDGRRYAHALAHAFVGGQRAPAGPAAENVSMLGESILGWASSISDASYSRRPAARLLSLRRLFLNRSVAQFFDYVERGRDDSVEPLRRLNVPPSSWVWNEAVTGGLLSALVQDDEVVDRDLDRYVELLHRHELVLDDGLGHILNRLASSSNRDDRPALRELVVGRWGNPMPRSNHQRWLQHTTDAGRRLVAGWIAQRVIKSFFEHLAGPTADVARTQFWSRYAESIDEFWVYLGSQARLRGAQVQAELRDALGESLGRLDHGSNNAFVMMIGEYAFVEFSETNNALFVYERDRMPIELRRPNPRAEDLKDQIRRVEKFSHQSGWQDRVRRFIGNEARVWPR